jgi:hypothetical protein
MKAESVTSVENQDAVDQVVAGDKDEASSCATGKCPFSSPRLMAFALPFFAALALEQWVSVSSTPLTATVCQMCALTKTALALACGMVGLAVQKFLAKR